MIKLLNSSLKNKEDLLPKMNDDSFYYGELNQLALSHSTVKLLIEDPKSYWNALRYGSAQTQAMRDGYLFHLAILEPHKFEEARFVNVRTKRTKAYMEAKAQFGEVYTIQEKEDAERLQDAFQRNEMALKMITDCEFEVPMIGEVMGYPFRGKADVLGKDRIVDIKTTTDLKNFSKSVDKYSYDTQVFIYCNLYGLSYDQFKFVVCDKRNLTFGLGHCSKEMYERGKLKVQYAIEVFKEYFEGKTEDEIIAKLDNHYKEFTL